MSHSELTVQEEMDIDDLSQNDGIEAVIVRKNGVWHTMLGDWKGTREAWQEVIKLLNESPHENKN